MMKLPSDFQIDSLFVGHEKWKEQMENNLSHCPPIPYLFATLKAATGKGVCAFDAHHLHKLFQKNGHTHPETGEKCIFVDYFIMRQKDETPKLYRRCKPNSESIRTFAAACCRSNAYGAMKAHFIWLKSEVTKENRHKHKSDFLYWGNLLLTFDLPYQDKQEILSLLKRDSNADTDLLNNWKGKKQLTAGEFCKINDHFSAAYKRNSDDIATLLEWGAFLWSYGTTDLEKGQVASFTIKAARIFSQNKDLNITDYWRKRLQTILEQTEVTETFIDSIYKDL